MVHQSKSSSRDTYIERFMTIYIYIYKHIWDFESSLLETVCNVKISETEHSLSYHHLLFKFQLISVSPLKMAENGRTPSFCFSLLHFLISLLWSKLYMQFSCFSSQILFLILQIIWILDSLSGFLASAVDAAKRAGEVC